MKQYIFGSPDLDAELLPVADKLLAELRRVPGYAGADVKSNRAMIACYVLAAVNDDASNDINREGYFMHLVTTTISIYRVILARKKGQH